VSREKIEVALGRYAAVSFIEEKVREGLPLVQAFRLAELRRWPNDNGDHYAIRTLEDYWYGWKSGGFSALQPKSRADDGTFRRLPEELGDWLLSQVGQYPAIPLTVLYLRWSQAGKQLPSLSTIYRFLRSKGYHAASLQRRRPEIGTTNAFPEALVNKRTQIPCAKGVSREKFEVALGRYAAVSFIEQKVREGLPLVQALRLAELRRWPNDNGDHYAIRTLEDYWYGWKSGGFSALQPKSRTDDGTFRRLPAELGDWLLLSQVGQYPVIPLKVLYLRWSQAGKQLPSLSTIYRFLRRKGYHAASLQRRRPEIGTTNACHEPFVNDLWMADFLPGPKLHVEGKVLTTHLCLILDDFSRVITSGAYYSTADTPAFHDALTQAVLRRGIPYQLYTDLGKPFVNKHTQILCANLGICLQHTKPYAAWSKRNVDKCFLTIQQSFESTLVLEDNRNLAELNQKLTRWIQSVYHLSPHSPTGLSPLAVEAIVTLHHREPALPVSTVVRKLQEVGVLEPGTFSRASVYRLFHREWLNRPSIGAEGCSPTNNFETKLGYAISCRLLRLIRRIRRRYKS
jgi:putative transposase